VEGSRLGRWCREEKVVVGGRRRVRVEWEVVEWSEGGEEGEEGGESPRKRKLREV
jgi:hypothetical protein